MINARRNDGFLWDGFNHEIDDVLTGHADSHVLTTEQSAITGDGPKHIGSWLVENRLNHPSSIPRGRRNDVRRRPWRIRIRPGVLPGFHLLGNEGHAPGAAVNDPRQPQPVRRG